MNQLQLRTGTFDFPIFLPDATRAVVRGIDSEDLERCGVNGLVMSTFHLMQHPGSTVVAGHGGLHQFAGWRKPIVTDSGGFQVYSLVRQNPKYGTLNEKGMIYRADDGTKYNLTPEKSIQLQVSYGGDIVFCLDDCTHADSDEATQVEAVRRTIKWAKRCREEFDLLVKQKKWTETERPLLFGVVQGGNIAALRQECAEALLAIGFDGYGYGGYPLDSENKLLTEMFEVVRQQIPLHYPLHALGVGHPANVLACAQMGYTIFDSALPTRDARRGRLYRMTGDPRYGGDNWYEFLYLEDGKHTRTTTPISETCDCPTCARYSVAYLHHLFSIEDTLYIRLVTMHNLRFMTRMMELLRAERVPADGSSIP